MVLKWVHGGGSKHFTARGTRPPACDGSVAPNKREPQIDAVGEEILLLNEFSFSAGTWSSSPAHLVLPVCAR